MPQTTATHLTSNLILDDGNGTPASPGSYFGFGITVAGAVASTGPRIYSLSANPNGTLTAPIGSIALNRTTAALYQNTNGGTTWATLSSGGTLGPLPDDVYLVMGTDSDGEIGFNSGADAIVLETLTRGGGAASTAALLLRTGTSSASGTGGVTIVSGAAAAGASGAMAFASGTATGSASGILLIKSGNTTGAASGAVSVTSGSSSATSGAVNINSGGGGTGTGALEVKSGNASAGTSGVVTISSGNGTAANAASGDVVLATGTPDGSGTKGSIVCTNGNQIVPPIPTTGTTVVAATIATPVTYVLDLADTASGNATFTLPYAIEVTDVIVRKTGGAGDASNTIQLLNGATALCEAIPQPTAAGTIQRNNETATSTATTSGTTLTVAVVRVGGSSACRIYVSGVRR